MNYLLRVEAVNLAAVTQDCKDLSAIRGGGLILLDTPENLAGQFGFTTVSTGASQAVFSFQANGDPEAETRRREVVNHLGNHSGARHATFIVTVTRDTGNFAKDRETLIAKVRFEQMRSRSLVWPGTGSAVCETDGLRPCAPGETQSRSVIDRRTYGRERKKDFYARVNQPDFLRRRQLPPATLPAAFTNDFNALASDPARGNLHNKMAVIHIDGNKFGKAQSSIDTVAGQQTFDRTVQDARLHWLHHHLDSTHDKPGWLNAGEHRMEILQWGGDEVLFIVPAWQGWAALRGYFQATTPLEFSGQQLTHCAGIVFCNRKAPIHSITSLADKLTREAKGAFAVTPGNYFCYQVLESFDTLGSDIDTARSAYRAGGGPLSLVLHASCMAEAASVFPKALNKLPRRKVHEVARCLLSGQDAADALRDKELIEAQQSLGADWPRLRNALTGADHTSANTFWIHLNELWDYLQGGSE